MAQFFLSKKIIFFLVRKNVRNFQEKKKTGFEQIYPKKMKVFRLKQVLQNASANEFYRKTHVKQKDVAFAKIFSTVPSQTNDLNLHIAELKKRKSMNVSCFFFTKRSLYTISFTMQLFLQREVSIRYLSPCNFFTKRSLYMTCSHKTSSRKKQRF